VVNAAAAAGRTGPAGVQAALFGPDAWARPVAERYAGALDIDPELLGALLVVACARVVAASGAHNGFTPAPARDAATRHLLLWRHALERATATAAPRP
jgi:hypothetical protein